MSTGVAENSIKKVLAGDLLTLKQVAPRFEDVPAEALTGAELFAIIRGKRGTRERDLRLPPMACREILRRGYAELPFRPYQMRSQNRSLPDRVELGS